MKNKKYWVYVHTFPNGKKYVGLTTQKNINRRWQGGRGYKIQPLVYRAILKYGWKNIVHQVFECETEAEMKYLERYLISYYQSNNPKYGYNISSGGDGVNGVPSKRRRAVNQYDKQGNLIKTWDSIFSIEEELNYSHSNISACTHKRKISAYGFYWFFTNETPIFKTKWTHRKVLQYSLTGEFIAEFENSVEAGKSLGKNGSSITKCCNGKLKSAYNFIWIWKQ